MCQPSTSGFTAAPADRRFETEPDTKQGRRQAQPDSLSGRGADGSDLLIMQDVAPVSVVPRKRRGVELALIIFALGLAVGAYALVDLNVTGELSPSFPYLAGISTLLAALAHISVRWRLPYADPVILPCVILLNGLGLVMIHRIDLINDPPLNGARQQLIWTALGVLIFILVVTWLNDHRQLQGLPYTIALPAIVLWLFPLWLVWGKRSSAPGSGSRSVPTASNLPRRPRSCSLSPSRLTWSRSATYSRSPAIGCSASTCHGLETSVQSWGCG